MPLTDVMPMDTEARKERMRSVLTAYVRKDLQGAEFRRLLRLAHTEGLLAGLLQNLKVRLTKRPMRQFQLPGNRSNA